jgi:hypothetical protein
VTRWDRGTYDVVERTEAALTLRLRGRRLAGNVVLLRGDDAAGRWTFRYDAD